jgi:hypothetical protein
MGETPELEKHSDCFDDRFACHFKQGVQAKTWSIFGIFIVVIIGSEFCLYYFIEK